MSEQIVLSKFDLNMLIFFKQEKTLKDFYRNGYIPYTRISRHLKRLTTINLVDVRKFGTFKFVKINDNGQNLLSLINYG